VRARSGPRGRIHTPATRSRPRRRLPGRLLGILVAAGVVLAAAGGVVFGARPVATATAGSVPPRPAPRFDVDASLEVAGPGDLPVPEPPAPPAPPAPEPAPAPSPAPVASRGAFPVARTEVDLVDPTRATPPRGDDPARDGRVLHTVIRCPDGPTGGPFPLVVFAHGYATRTAAYASLLDDLAAAG